MGDLFTPSVTRISDDGSEVYTAFCNTTGSTPSITPISDEAGQFIATNNNRVIKVEWNGHSPEVTQLETLFTGPPGTVFSSMAAAEDGTYYFSSYSDNYCQSGPTNSVWKYTKEAGFTRAVSDLIASYGIAIDEDRNTVYVNDPCSGIFAYGRDASGDLCKSFTLKWQQTITT